MKSLTQLTIKNSVAQRLLKSVFAVYFSITLAVTSFQLYSEFQNIQNSVDNEIQSLKTAFAPGLASALWSTDDAQVASIIAGMKELPHIEGVLVIDSDEQPVAFRGREELEHAGAEVLEKFKPYRFPVSYQRPDGDSEELGFLTIFTRKELVFERAQHSLLLILVSSFVKTIALWFIILFFLRRIFVIPLGIMADLLHEREEWPKLAEQERFFREHELKDLYESFQSMSRSINGNIEQLEQRVREENDKFVSAQQTTLQLGASVAGIAHDIANPIQLIIHKNQVSQGATQNLAQAIEDILKDSEDPQAKEVMTYLLDEIAIIKESNATIAVCSDRIEKVQRAIRVQSRQDLKAEVHPLLDIIEESLIILQMKVKTLRVRIDCPPEITLSCVRHQLGQVLGNLLSNAADALEDVKRPDRGPWDIIIRALTPQPGLLWIEIEDDGPGLAAEIQAKLFTSQVTSKAVGKGTGIGLPMSRKLVREHGGDMEWASPRELRGVCFRIVWPLGKNM